MSLLDDDLAAIHSDALSLGMANSITYNGVPITATFSESAEPFFHDEGAEKRRRTCVLDVRRASVASPAKGDTVVSTAGAYAGTWTVVDLGSSDDAGHVLTVRLDDRIKAGTGRRMP